MPYSGAGDSSLPSNVQSMGTDDKKQWVAIFNNTYAACKKSGGSAKECEGKAFRIANGVLKRKQKATSTRIIDILSAKIHEAFTIASDQLTQRGYLSQEERIPLSKLIGDLLDKFGNDIATDVAGKIVSEEDVFAIAEKEELNMAEKDNSGFLAMDENGMGHLPTRKGGKLDHGLMGAAWAALHGGYRGNKYEGPDKQKAIAKLKKMYESEDMPMPSEKEMSLEGMRSAIEEGFKMEFCHDMSPTLYNGDLAYSNPDYPYIVDIYPEENYIVARAMGKAWKVNYKMMDDGMATFDPLNKWVEVKPELNWVEKELESGISIFKQDNGKHRWVGYSATAHKDKEGEIISTAALEADVERTDKENHLGPLRWWHVGFPDAFKMSAGPGVDFGTTDFAAMHNHVLIESGEFFDNEVAEKIKEHQDEFGISIGFFHPINEPIGGVYNKIYRHERSLLPKHRAANMFATLATKEEQVSILKTKLEALAKLIGTEKAKQVVEGAEKAEAKADELGIQFKELADKVEARADAPEKGLSIAEMTPEEFNTLLNVRISENLKAELKPITDALALTETKQTSATKELGESILEAVSKLAEESDKLNKRLGVLEGEQPRGFRASRAKETAINEETKKEKFKGAEPREDETGVKSFMQFALGGPAQPN